MLRIGKKFLDQMAAHALDGYPLEVCGLLAGVEAGPGTAEVRSVHRADNITGSARVYEVDPRALLRVDREAEAGGGQVLGVYHSHTHTDAKPSPTDIASAPDPGWHYVLVSLRDEYPAIRSWHIENGKIQEEEVVLEW